MGDEWLCATAEEAEQVIDNSTRCCRFRNDRFEDQRIADFLAAAHGLLFFEPVEDSLHGRIGWLAVAGQLVPNLADRRRAIANGPISYSCSRNYYKYVESASPAPTIASA
jgi:hypothetical protein